MPKLWQYLRAKAAWPKRVDLPKALEETGKQLAQESGQTGWIDIAAPFIEKWEGLHRIIPGDKVAAYPDPATGDKPWTIGIGSTTDEDGYPIAPGTVWTIERARQRFRAHLIEFEDYLDGMLDGAPTTPNQRAALLSLLYNIGVGSFGRSTALRRHKAKDYEGAAEALTWFNKANGMRMRGLVRRRAAEKELYLS